MIFGLVGTWLLMYFLDPDANQVELVDLALDVQTLHGSMTSIMLLQEGGVESADLLNPPRRWTHGGGSPPAALRAGMPTCGQGRSGA